MLVKKSLINSWASALESIALKENKTNAFVEQANAIIDLLKENPDFVSLLSVQQSSDKVRLEIIDNVFKPSDFDVYIINALKLMVQGDLIFHARDIFKMLRKKLATQSDITFGVVWSISELPEKTVKTIEENISKKLNQKVKLVNKIDKSLIGGVQVVVAGQKFDGSLRGKLQDIKSIIANANNIEN